MSIEFDMAADFLLNILEGPTLTHDPVATRFGMTSEFDGVNPETLTFDGAKIVFKAKYWDPCKGDKLPFAAAFLVVDCALVNSGVRSAIARMQNWLTTLEPDGHIGPLTIARAKEVCGDPDQLNHFVNKAVEDRRSKSIQVYSDPGDDQSELRGLLNRYNRAAGFALAWSS